MRDFTSPILPEPLAETAVARVRRAAPAGRLSLRARGDVAPLEAALGLSLPGAIGQRTGAGGTEALRLGPDEWIIHAPEDRVAGLREACDAIYDAHPHSLVDVSGREVTLLLDGPQADVLLTLGMARDPDSIAVGEGRRTLFDGVTVILWRDAPTTFRMDVWHSFAPHVIHLLQIGCRELAAETA